MIDKVLKSLNDEQIKPVLQTEGPVLVLAGAGSGKTRVLTSRIAYLIEVKNVPAYNILAITFTNKASKEMQERIFKIVGEKGQGAFVSTIHSMCVRILRSSIDKIGFDRNFSIYTEVETKNVLNRIIKEKKIETKDFLKNVRFHISNCKNANISIDDYEKLIEYNPEVENIIYVFREYQSYLKKVNALDFDDLLIKTRQLLIEDKDVLEHFQDRFKYIHVDEFQDTNDVQFEIIKMLSLKHRNLFAVGDDDQSIYGWRGANISNILNFEKTFPDSNVFKLERNYRSTKNILDCANRVIRNNTARKDKTLWTDKEPGVRVESYMASDDRAEAAYVAQNIRALIERGNKYSDFGILMRINAISLQFEQELMKYNIPCRMIGGFKFFDRKEVKDALSYLMVVSNHFDEQAIIRSINTPKRGIGDTLVNKLISVARATNTTLFAVIMEIEEYQEFTNAQKKSVRCYRDIIKELINANNIMPLNEFIDFAIETTTLKSMYVSQSDEDIAKRMNIDQLASLVKDFYEDNENATLFDYLQSAMLSSDLDDNSDSEQDKVTLATIHSVKGLEFKVVFVVGLEDNILPISRSFNDENELQEERRLLYVAITRAKERLYLTRSKMRYLYNNRNYMMPSRFLKEAIPEVKEIRTSDNEYIRIQEPVKKIEPKKPSNTEQFRNGTKVLHKAYGEGVIISRSGKPDNVFVDVAFKGFGVKKFALNYAPLEIID